MLLGQLELSRLQAFMNCEPPLVFELFQRAARFVELLTRLHEGMSRL